MAQPTRADSARPTADDAGRWRAAEELYRRGRAAGNGWRPHDAARLLHRALRLLERTEPMGSAVLRAQIMITLSSADTEIHGLETGLRWLVSAEKRLTELGDPQLRDNLAAKVHGQRGLLFARTNLLAEGIAALSEGIAIGERSYARALASQHSGDYYSLATNLLNRALAHIAVGHPGPADRDLRRLEQVVDSGLAESNRSDADDLAMLRAKAHHAHGALAWRIGDIPQALLHQEQAGASYRELEPSALPKLRTDQAEILLTAGLADDAATLLDDVIPRLHRQRDFRHLAEAELLRAAAAVFQGDLDTTHKYANSARRRFRRHGDQAWAAIVSLIRLRADVNDALARDKVPATLADRAMDLAAELAELKLLDESAVARMLAVRLQLRRGLLAIATEQFALVPRPRRVTPVDHRMLRRLCLAELAVAGGARRRAFSQARAGLAELGRVRDRMGGAELVSGTAVHGRELGRLAVRLVIEHSRAPARPLFGWTERTRAQVYRYQPLPQPEEPELADKVREYRYLSRAVQQARMTGANRRDLVSRHASLSREMVRLGWRDSPWGAPRPVADVAEVIGALGDAAMVSFLNSDNEISALVVCDNRVRLLHLGDMTDVAVAAQELHADLDALAPDTLPPQLVAAVSGSAARRAERLDARLIQPLLKLIGDRELVIIPTGALYATAWGALPSLCGRPVVVAPSATAWLAAARADDQDGHTVLVGGPHLTAAVGEVGGLREHHLDARMIPADQATVEGVLSALDGAALAHVAAHGTHEPENALFSHLDLLDGALFAHEITRLRRPPQHVVLAACELALSRIRPGDEALGFAGALLAAGG
ncbi:MAG TPA: CHAT domain-containing protein, partial [Pseudonocardiaceae bacterium]|nr:CHAT domain-containing protein [Pseudonocardiaceae bacterium]